MKKRSILAILVITFFICMTGLSGMGLAYAATSVSVLEIDYEKETLTVQAGSGDTQIFFASSSTSTAWDAVYGELDENNCVTMDISWASKTSDVIFYIKGDVSVTPVKVTLPKQTSNFKASLNITTNTVSFSNVGTATEVYWRKSTSSKWNTLRFNNENDVKAFQSEMERFSLQGITLYFRTGQVKGSAASKGARPSKESSIKVTKRASAPNVKADYSKLTISATAAMEYKKSESDTWISVSGSSLKFSDIASDLLYSQSRNTDVDEVSVDVRTKATQSKVASRTVTLTIPIQQKTDDRNIDFSFTGSTQAAITIDTLKDNAGEVLLKAASTSNPYEYTFVKKETGKALSALDISTATWTAITSNSAVTITSGKTPEGSMIYVRKKATSTELAGYPISIEVGAYPTASSITAMVEFKKVCGMEGSLTSFDVKVPYKNTKISSITFGGKTAGFKAGNAVEGDGFYTITVTINDTTEIEAVAANLGKTLEGIITLDNGDTIEDKIELFIYPAAKLTGTAHVLFKDILVNDDLEITLALGHEDKKQVTVSQITVNDIVFNYTIKDDEDFADNYKKIITISKEVLTAYAEGTFKSSQLGTAIPVIITLSNGEKIETGVTITVKMAATVSSSSTGIGISLDAYKQNQKEIADALAAATASEGTVTINVESIFENPELTITIDSALFAKDDSYIVSSVEWQGVSVLRNFTMSGNIIKVTLDISKIVSIGTGSSTVVVKIASDDNNISIGSAYKITVVQ